MIGAVYLNQLRHLISETSGTWVDLRTTFDFLYEAAKDFSKETKACHNSQTITTVANQAEYDLNPDFLEVMTKDDHDLPVIKLTDASGNISWLSWESYSDYLQSSNSASTPSSFAITDRAISTRLTGVITTGSTPSGGETSLIATGGTFTAVVAGDIAVNTTNSYYGYVLVAGTSPTTAMFNLTTSGGAYVGWTIADAYMIQPAPRYKLILDPAPDTTGQIVTVPYLAKPTPVYSDYGVYPFATGYEEALISYAAWKYRYRDSKPQLGDPLYLAYERQMRKAKNVQRKATGAIGFRVNFMK